MKVRKLSLMVGAILIISLGLPLAALAELTDFRVNEENYPAIYYQSEPSVASAPDGRFVVCWQDTREAFPDYSYPYSYFQLFSSTGERVGGNIKLDSFFVVEGPVAAMNSSGQFVIAYIRAGREAHVWPNLYVKRYDASGRQVGEILKVAACETDYYYVRYPSISINDSGHIAVTFKGTLKTGGDYLYVQYLDFATGLIGGNVSFDTIPQFYDKSSQVIIDNRNRVFFSVVGNVSPYGTKQTIKYLNYPNYMPSAAIEVDSGFRIEGQEMRDMVWNGMAVNPEGKVLTTWRAHIKNDDGQNGWVWTTDSTYMMMLDNDLNVITPKTALSDPDLNDKFYLLMARPIATASGFELAGIQNNPGEIRRRRVLSDGSLSDWSGNYPTVLQADYWEKFQIVPKAGAATFIWGCSSGDIEMEGISDIGDVSQDRQAINDDIGAFQTWPSVAVDKDGSKLAVWIDYRETLRGSIYGQIFDPAGTPLGNNFRVRTSGTDKEGLRLASNGSDRVVAVWYENAAYPELWSQIYDYPSFTPVGAPFKFHTSPTAQPNPDVGVKADKSFVLTWSCNLPNDTVRAAHMANYSASGVQEGDSKVLLQTKNGVRLRMLADGSFALGWREQGKLRGQFFSAEGVAQGSYFDISDHEYPAFLPEIAVNLNGQVGFAWSCWGVWSGGPLDGVWFRAYEPNGTPLCLPTRISQYNINTEDDRPCGISSGPGGDFVMVWTDSLLGNSDIWGQRITPAGQNAGFRQRINRDMTQSNQQRSAIFVHDDEVAVIWEDFRGGLGSTDIYSRTFNWGDFDAFVCGDIDNSGRTNVLDVTYLIRFLYKGGPSPVNFHAADVNSDGSINLLDVTVLINYLYRGGVAPTCN